MRVLIVGGGIGGLTTALCCAHFGHEVVVLEQAEQFAEVGAGIQIPPNAMKVFSALGVAERIARDAVTPTHIQARMGRSGRHLFSVPLADAALTRWGSHYLHIHRADYIQALTDSLKERTSVTLRLGASVTRVDQTGLDVSATFADGSSVRGDILIGADGIHSRVRETLLGPDEPTFTGNIAWRAVVPMDALGDLAPDPTACVWMGPGRHAVTYQMRRGTLINFVGVVERDDPGAEDWMSQGAKSAALADFAGWHPTITALIKAVPDGSLFRWALYDRLPLSRWTDGRLALLGDAAHPMLPFLAQGAAMAVEDAWVLAEEIFKADRSVLDSLKAYEHRRLGRTARVQAASCANAKTFHKKTALSQAVTYGPMWLAGKVAPGMVRQRLDWLYGKDVAAA